MRFKYQVVSHDPYYPSSVLFETLQEAQKYYNSIKGANYEEDILITLCKVVKFKGEEPKNPKIEWYLDFNEQGGVIN